MPGLTGAEVETLRNLLASALSAEQLETLVYTSTGDRLYEAYVAPNKPLRPTISDLLIELERLGTTQVFLAVVYQRRPNRPDVRAEIARLCPDAVALALRENNPQYSVQVGGQANGQVPADAFTPGLQRNVRPYLTKVDVGVWVQRLSQITARVCRIEFRGKAAGTGFLVGPATVLTNWHVAEPVSKANAFGDVVCRFDYSAASDGTVRPGIEVKLGPRGCIDSTPYAAAEITETPENPPPTAAELDYALLALKDPIGDQDVNGSRRGWIDLPAAAQPLEPDSPLLIVQHPNGLPMKLAVDTQAVIGRTAGDLRIRYRTNTDPGSSGSPCFSINWDLVALHHYGDPAWQAPKFNQGIPAELIRARLLDQGHGGELGA